MAYVRWVKQQDFCLRLGLLRALLVLLPTHGRSVDRGPVLRKIDHILFGRLKSVPWLDDAVAQTLGARADEVVGRGKSGARGKFATIADGLLIRSGNPSWGQPIDAAKSSKMLEWAHASGLVGAGNQITERGQLLRSLFPADPVAAFASGRFEPWNPFIIPRSEQVFLLYHLGELDEMLWRLAVLVGNLGAHTEISPTRARRIASEAMNAVLAHVDGTAPLNEMPRVRVLRELAGMISAEVADDPQALDRLVRRRGPSKSFKPAAMRTERRQTTKNADHQAVPRFEMLVDLGFLAKPVSGGLAGADLWKAKNAWSFVVTPAAAAFATYVHEHAIEPVAPWHWHHFASACGAARLEGATRHAGVADVIDLLLDSYDHVQRRAGHTPFESVALLTMVRALDSGLAIEVGDIHRAFSELKSSGVLGDFIYFAAGNEVDRMFILLKPGARDALRELVTRPRQDVAGDGLLPSGRRILNTRSQP